MLKYLLATTTNIIMLLTSTSIAATLTIDVSTFPTPGLDTSNTLITLTPEQSNTTPAQRSGQKKIEIEQKNRQFNPFIQAVPKGEKINFPNADTVAHHVYSFSQPNSFELPLYQKNSNSTHTFKHNGVVILGCNIHDWMLSYLLVTDAPYFGRVDNNTLLIPNIAPGRYTLKLWHPGMQHKEPEHTIIVQPDSSRISIQLQQELQDIQAPNEPSGGFGDNEDYF